MPADIFSPLSVVVLVFGLVVPATEMVAAIAAAAAAAVDAFPAAPAKVGSVYHLPTAPQFYLVAPW